jgi:hypothetical protein
LCSPKSCRVEEKRPQKGLVDLRSVIARVPSRNWPGTARGAVLRRSENGTSAAVASSSSVKSSNVSKSDKNMPPESLTLRLKKAETAVEVATASVKHPGLGRGMYALSFEGLCRRVGRPRESEQAASRHIFW